MSGSTSDQPGAPRVADTPTTPASTKETQGVTTADELAGDESTKGYSIDAAVNPLADPTRTPEEVALDTTPRTGPLPGDDPDANPSHPSSLRVRRADGELQLKNQRDRSGDPLVDQPPGFEVAEAPRAVPSHPSKLVPTPDSVSAYRLVDAFGEQPASDAETAADVSDERKALAQTDQKGLTTVRYLGDEAVTVVVPDGGGGYDGLQTTGQTFNFRPGEAKAVPTKAAGWLRKHPVLKFEK